MIYDKTLYLLFVHFQAKAERTVHHFHFTQWPDHGVPDKIKLVSFYRKVNSLQVTDKSKNKHYSIKSWPRFVQLQNYIRQNNFIF